MTTLSARIAQGSRKANPSKWSPEVTAKAKLVFIDYLSCAYESLDLAWSRQAMEIAGSGSVSVIGRRDTTSAEAAAFVNAILGGSADPAGAVIFSTLLATAEDSAKIGPGRVTAGKVSGRDFIAGVVCGFEVRAVLEKVSAALAGPVGAAAGAARMLGLDQTTSVNALGLTSNSGLNGAKEARFQIGFAARNAVTAVKLAMLGARPSARALDGGPPAPIKLFAGPPEILNVRTAETAIRKRFRGAASKAISPSRAQAIERFIQTLETCQNLALIGPLLAAGERK